MVSVGQKVTVYPNFMINKNGSTVKGSKAGIGSEWKPLKGVVTYIHPSKRWYMVEFSFVRWGVFGERMDRTLRECFWTDDCREVHA